MPTIDRLVAAIAELVSVAMAGPREKADLAVSYLRGVAEGLITPADATWRLVFDLACPWGDPVAAGGLKRARAREIAADAAAKAAAFMADEAAAARWLQELRLCVTLGVTPHPLGRSAALWEHADDVLGWSYAPSSPLPEDVA